MVLNSAERHVVDFAERIVHVRRKLLAGFGFVQEGCSRGCLKKRPKVVITLIFKRKINFDIFGDILTLRFAAKP